MLSEFGKFTRKLRIDHSELLKDMSQRLNVTTSYLSAVEMGKRSIPKKWRNILITEYCLNEEDIKELDEAIYNSQEMLKLKLQNYSDEDKSLILSFARKFNELENKEKDSIRKILNSERRWF